MLDHSYQRFCFGILFRLSSAVLSKPCITTVLRLKKISENNLFSYPPLNVVMWQNRASASIPFYNLIKVSNENLCDLIELIIQVTLPFSDVIRTKCRTKERLLDPDPSSKLQKRRELYFRNMFLTASFAGWFEWFQWK